MKTLSKRALGLAVTVMLASGASLADGIMSADVMPSNNANLTGTSTLYRHAYGIGMTATVAGLRGGTDLRRGHPYTIWAIIFNVPEECTNYPDPCDPDDFAAGRGHPGVAQASRNYSDDYGNGYFSGFVPVNGALVYPYTAEVHFVYRRHPDHNDEYVSLNDVIGNCAFRRGELVDGPRRNQCEDEGFSIHQAEMP